MSMLPAVSSAVYRRVAKPLLFRKDPEDAHDAVTRLGAFLGAHGSTRLLTFMTLAYADPSLRQRLLGIGFPNPVGLAAGFDKNALLVDIMPSVGFGFMEIGSVTGEPCAGNPRPRLWRLPRSRSLAVNFGLKNDGCEAIAARLEGRRFGVPLGTSIAKTNSPATVDPEAAIADYEKAYATLATIGDYSTVNISCPNAYGGQPFTDPGLLDRLLERLAAVPTRKPVFIKLSPDLEEARTDAIVDVGLRRGVNGFICANLTKDRLSAAISDDDAVPSVGGLSGKVASPLADVQIARVFSRTRGKSVVVGCGGVFTAEDAYRKIRLGASLVQMITGLIYEGPQVVGQINRGLARLLRRDGFSDVSEARGADASW